MSTSARGENPPPLDAPRPSTDRKAEPVGYSLDSAVTYEQPPLHAPGVQEILLGPLTTRQATTGLALGLVGVVADPLLPVLAVPLGIATVIVSLTALYQCLGGVAAGRSRAIAGLALGLLGVLFGIGMLVWWFFMDGLSGA